MDPQVPLLLNPVPKNLGMDQMQFPMKNCLVIALSTAILFCLMIQGLKDLSG